jgi:O-antigen/teichoic acid export membrane protein
LSKKIDHKGLSAELLEKEGTLYETRARKKSLAYKVIGGTAWILSLRLINHVINIIRRVILARLLSPHDFGLMGVAFISITFLESLSKTGIHSALVQKEGDIRSYLDTVWTITSVRSIVIFSILFLSAPMISCFFNSPEAVPVIRLLGLSTLFTGFRNIGVIYFIKELEFKKQFIYEFAGIAVNLVVSVVLAILYQNVWALVWGWIAGSGVRLCISFIVHPYRPKMQFNKQKFCEIFNYGKWVAGSAILIYIINQGDDIFVGKLLGLTALGLYQMAYFVSNFIASEISQAISQVSFPAYSKLQDFIPKLRTAYSEILQLTALISFPIAGGIFVLCSDLTLFLLGEKWIAMIPALRILIAWGLIRSLGTLTGSLFQAVGRPDIATKLHFAKAILLLLTIYPFTKLWGISGAAIAVVLNAILVNPFAHYQVSILLKEQIGKFIKLIIIPTAGMLTMCPTIYLLKNIVLIDNKGISLVVNICAGVIIYGLVVSFLDWSTGFRIRNLLLHRFGQFKP